MRRPGKKSSPSEWVGICSWILLLLTGYVSQDRAHGAFCMNTLQQECRHLIIKRDGDSLFPIFSCLPQTGWGIADWPLSSSSKVSLQTGIWRDDLNFILFPSLLTACQHTHKCLLEIFNTEKIYWLKFSLTDFTAVMSRADLHLWSPRHLLWYPSVSLLVQMLK